MVLLADRCAPVFADFLSAIAKHLRDSLGGSAGNSGTSTEIEIAEFAGQLFFRLWRASHTHVAEALQAASTSVQVSTTAAFVERRARKLATNLRAFLAPRRRDCMRDERNRISHARQERARSAR
ncbi:MAG: hypothetical protein ACM33U_07660, partial [Solirubrobacterales bacterium]